MRLYLYVLVILAFCIRCNQSDSKNPLIGSIDTAKVIREANIVESYSEIPDSLNNKLDTITLAYIAFACDCPNYVNLTSQDSVQHFREAYYLEPASVALIIPELLLFNRNEFELVGLVTQKNGLPKYHSFTDPNPPTGPVFTYWSYKVKRPFTFYGPKVKEVGGLGDTAEIASQIRVQ